MDTLFDILNSKSIDDLLTGFEENEKELEIENENEFTRGVNINEKNIYFRR